MHTNIFIVIPIHNRKSVTLMCLQNLKHNGDLVDKRVIIVDDGSTDGSKEAVLALYPDVVVLDGDGNLWWTGAIALGMKYAFGQGADYIIWLNDDALPERGCLNILLQSSKDDCTISGAQGFKDKDFTEYYLSGYRRYGLFYTRVKSSNGDVIKCSYLSGNCVCIPRKVIEAIGFPDEKLAPHYFGDVLYTFKAFTQGLTVQVVGNARVYCPVDPSKNTAKYSAKKIFASSSPIEQARHYLSIKSGSYPLAKWNKELTTSGIVGIIPIFRLYISILVVTILSLLLPISFRNTVLTFIQKLSSLLPTKVN